MDWTNNVTLIFDPLRELAAYGSDAALRDALNEGTPELIVNNFDNWNGGTTTYTLSISVPVHVFVQIEERIAAIEAKILEKVKNFTRAETNDFIDSVFVRPGATTTQRVVPPSETPFWLPGHLKLFISHLSGDKARATNLKDTLKSFAISSFVAHEDIEPTREWQLEIEKALFSMDALTAVLTKKFNESKWTDQEVGVALGRGIAVLPIRAGIDPYGLMGKFQGIPSMGKSVGDVAKSVVTTLLKNPKTRARLVQCLVEQLLTAADATQAASKLEALELAIDLPVDQLIRIRDNAATNPNLYEYVACRLRINALLGKHGVESIQAKPTTAIFPNDEIPF